MKLKFYVSHNKRDLSIKRSDNNRDALYHPSHKKCLLFIGLQLSPFSGAMVSENQSSVIQNRDFLMEREENLKKMAEEKGWEILLRS